MLEDPKRLGCKNSQSRVADSCCNFWAVFSERTLLTKSVAWKSAQQTLWHCRCISAWEPRPCQVGSQKVSQSPCSDSVKTPPRASFLNRKSLACTWRFDRRICLLQCRFCWRISGGVVRGQIFCFRLADFPADFFGGCFFFAFCDQKSTAKIH